jgi:hypothetical protein
MMPRCPAEKRSPRISCSGVGWAFRSDTKQEGGVVRRTIWAMAVAVSMALAGAPAAPAAGFGPGSAGLGDPFFPLAGNGGYDVSDYALTLGYDPAMRRLDGHAVITATATQDLNRFDLDLRGFTVSALTVNGRAASFTRDGQELVVAPAQGVKSGGALSVVVDYAGVPDVITDPDGSIEGFVPTSDGAFAQTGVWLEFAGPWSPPAGTARCAPPAEERRLRSGRGSKQTVDGP